MEEEDQGAQQGGLEVTKANLIHKRGAMLTTKELFSCLVETSDTKLEFPNSGCRTWATSKDCFYYRANAIPRTFHALILSVHM